jgi:tRNA G46 methylase TrmB
MPGANSVTSNQETLHKDLEKVVRKYARTTFLRPIAEHTRKAFAEAEEFVRKFYAGNGDPVPAQGRDDMVSGVTNAMCGVTSGTEKDDAGTATRAVILDSGCGTGESTLNIALANPCIPVIGIDKSAARLSKAGAAPQNAFLVRAELLDFWRLALGKVKAGQWHIPYHALYYPNPWPKQSVATRRFHLHPIFPTLLQLGDAIELRTNWEIYAREFAEAARIATPDCSISHEAFQPERPITAFERKYKEARQQLWRVTINHV